MDSSEDTQGQPRSLLKQSVPIVFALMTAAYVTSYVLLSSRGMQRSPSYGVTAWYFVEPTSPQAFRVHRYLTYLYYPLILLDLRCRELPPGRYEPMFEFSGHSQPSKHPDRVGWSAFCDGRKRSPLNRFVGTDSGGTETGWVADWSFKAG